MALKLAITVVLGIISTPLQLAASSVDQGTRTETAFTETLPKPYGQARVTARLDAANQRLERLDVLFGEKRIEIPKKAFADLPKPDLRTLVLLYSRTDTSDPHWYAYVRFEYGDPVTPFPTEGRDRFSSVEITIENGRAVRRMVFHAENGGSSEYQEW